MEGIDIVRKQLESKNFLFNDTSKWKNVTYVCGDYYFRETNIKIAKYIFLHVGINEWKNLCSCDSAFITEVIEDIYYSLDKDLRWNLYLICVVRDEDLVNIDRYEKRCFENNIKYTRNFLLSESTLAQRIPIGKVLRNSNQHKIRYPLVEWQSRLQEYEFCMNAHTDESLLEILMKVKSDTQEKAKLEEILLERIMKLNQEMARVEEPLFETLMKQTCYLMHRKNCNALLKFHMMEMSKEQNNLYEEHERIQIRELFEIKMPKMFRPHLYPKDWILPCRKCNLLYGSNGTGKTSVLSAVELTVTGTIDKPKMNVADCADQAEIQIKVLCDNKIETLSKPDKIQAEDREAKWYNYCGTKKTETQLNLLFHKFNYFSIDDTYRFANCSSDKVDIFSCLLYGEDTIKMWDNIQANCERCKQISTRLQRECENISEQIHQPPPMVDKIYDDIIKKNIKEIGLQISSSASLDEIVDIISDIKTQLAELSKYNPIVNKKEAENRIQEIDNQILSINKKEIRLERKIKRYRTFQASVNKICMLRGKGNDEVKIHNLEIEKEKKDNIRSELLNEKERMQKIVEFWENLSIYLSEDIYNNMDGEELEEHCRIINESIDQYNQFQSYLEELDNLIKKREKLTFQISCVDKLYDRLLELSPPEEYAKCYISNYIEEISQIFISLHTPQEFTELKIKDEEIVGIRNNEIVSLSSMSSGQRTAIAISVLFQLHLSNKTAPKFLLLDEPLATIDDLNSLLFMDYLRELVITHDRQLFVTTMSKNTAMLFRRKFSFLGESFQEISFNRESNRSYQIVQKIYDQKQLISESEL